MVDFVLVLFFGFPMSPSPSLLETLRAGLSRPGLSRPPRAMALGAEPVDLVLGGGLARGALHEVYGQAGHETAATGFAAGLAVRLAGKNPVLWIRQDYAAQEFGTACASGLCAFGLSPARLLFLCVTTAEQALRAALDALSCMALGMVIIEITGSPRILDLTASRRLVLAASHQGVGALLLRLGARPEPSAADTRWLVRAGVSAPDENHWGQPVFDVQLIRNRHGQTGRWQLSWCGDEECFQDAKAASGFVVSTPGDRQAAAA